MNREKSKNYPLMLWIVLASLLILRVWFAMVTELTPDEAYYWVWSNHLDWGYYDHPPMVAWLIRLGTILFGSSVLGIRLGALLLGPVTVWMIFLVTRMIMESERDAFWIAVLVAVSPLFSVGAVIHTPDAASAASWMFVCWFGLRAYRYERIKDWIGLGVSLGIAALAKNSGLMLLAGLALFVIGSKAGRERMKTPGSVIALILAALVVLPNMGWNSQHTGGSLAFQLKHTAGSWSLSIPNFLAFLTGQIGVVSPVLFVAVVAFWAVGFRRTVRFGRTEVFLLWCLSIPLFLCCLLLSWLRPVEANWPAKSYCTAIPAATWVWRGGVWYPRRIRTWFALAVASAMILSVLIHLHSLVPFLPLNPQKDPTAQLRGWRELAEEAVKEADILGAELFSEGYQTVSELRFYGKRKIYYEHSSSRLSQYDLWMESTTHQTILFLQPITTKHVPRVCEGFEHMWLLDKGVDSISHMRWRFRNYRWWVCEKGND